MKIFIVVNGHQNLGSLVAVAESLGHEAAGVQTVEPYLFPANLRAGIFGEIEALVRDFEPDLLALGHQLFGAVLTGRRLAESLPSIAPTGRIGLDELIDQSGYCEVIASGSEANIASLWSRFGRLPRSRHDFPYRDNLPARFRWVLQALSLHLAA